MTNGSGTTERLPRCLETLPRILQYAFIIFIAVTLVLNVAAAPFLDFHYKWALNDLGWLFLLIGLGLGVVLCMVVRAVSKTLSKIPAPALPPFLACHGFGIFIACGAVVLVVLQGAIITGCCFMGLDWDGPMMIWQTDQAWLDQYYGIYPNNLFLGGIFRTMRAAMGDVLSVELIMVLCAFGAASATASVCMTGFIVRRLSNVKCGVCAFLLAFVFVGLNPHMLVPYSDAYSLAFTAGILCSYVCCKKPLVKWPLITLLAAIGYALKPTVVMAVIAIVFVEAVLGYSRMLRAKRAVAAGPVEEAAAHRRSLRRRIATAVGTALLCVATFAMAEGCISATSANVGANIDEDTALSAAHYLRLGANDNDGTCTNEDRDYSLSWADPATRVQKNLERTGDRYRKKGLDGTMVHLMKKNLITYDNGDMWWYRPVRMFMFQVYSANEPLKQFYGVAASEEISVDGGMRAATPSPWSCIAQALWFMILAGIVLNAFARKQPKGVQVICITLLGLSAFLLLFEAGARYLFLYAPFYVILGVRGWQALGQWAERKRSSSTSSAST